jgi:hypothetical protein
LGNLAPAAGDLTKDGTYFVTNEPLLNVSRGVADVHLMIGSMCDDATSFAPFPTSINLTTEVSNLAPYTSLGKGPEALIASAQFPESSTPNATLNVFNVTAHMFSDATFRCPGAATAYAGFKNKFFKDIYYFEFNRSYQSYDWDLNSPVCHPPPTPQHPYGDLSLEYFKCHSGDL